MKNEHNVKVRLLEAEGIIETVRIPFLVLDAALKIVFANRAFYTTFKVEPDETLGGFIYALGNGQWNIPELRQLLMDILPEKKIFKDFEVAHTFPLLGYKVMLLDARQIIFSSNGTSKILLSLEDITERRNAQAKIEKLVGELQVSLANIKTLTGLLPICANCKKIRDDTGYWTQIESYIREHSDASFTHGICPECARKLYPEFYGDGNVGK